MYPEPTFIQGWRGGTRKILYNGSPLLLNEEVQNQETSQSEYATEYPQQRDIWPPERLQKLSVKMLPEKVTERTPARRPNIERIAAAGTSRSTPNYETDRCESRSCTMVNHESSPSSPSVGGIEAHSLRVPQRPHGRRTWCAAIGKRGERSRD